MQVRVLLSATLFVYKIHSRENLLKFMRISELRNTFKYMLCLAILNNKHKERAPVQLGIFVIDHW